MAVHYTPIPSTSGVANTAALFNSRLQELDNAIVADDTLIANIISGVQAIDVGRFSASSILTLSSNVAGAITIAKTRHQVDTFGAAAAGDLATLNGGLTGQILFLTSVNPSRVVTVKQTGNIKLASGADHVLDVDKALMLFYNGSNWSDVNSAGVSKVLYRRVELVATAASIAISSLPQNFSRFQLILEGRTNNATLFDSALLRFNGDTTIGNYYTESILWGAATVLTETRGTAGGILIDNILSGATAAAASFGSGEISITNYPSSSKMRRAFFSGGAYGSTASGGMRYAVGSGAWLNTTNPVTSITLLPVGGTLFDIGTAVTLYGYNA